MKLRFFLLLYFLLFSLVNGLPVSFAHASSDITSSETGTIVVTYQTDHEGHRLDRIRFWLINDKQERTLYPKKDEFVANYHHHHANLERTVVISQLPIGRYHIEFLLPNVDQFFEHIPSRTVHLTSNAVVKVDQTITLNTHKKERTDLALLDFKEPKSALYINNLNPLPPPIPFPFGPRPLIPVPTFPLRFVDFSLITNRPVSWKLMQNGMVVHEGIGSVSNFPIPPSRNYYVLAEEIPGYTLKMAPPATFEAIPGKNVKVELFYQRDFGFVSLATLLPSNQTNLTFTLTPLEDPQQPPLQVNLTAVEGKITWQSGPLGTGDYTVSYQLPDNLLPLPNQLITIQKGRYTVLTPRFTSKSSLQILTDFPQAIFTLTKEDGQVIGQGQGESYVFLNLEPAYYVLQFSSPDPLLFIPPENKKIFLAFNQQAQLHATYRKSGRVTVSSNVDHFTVTIEAQDTPEKSQKEEITHQSKNLYLPEGRYWITYEPLTPTSTVSKRLEMTIESKSPQYIFFPYDTQKTENKAKPKIPAKQAVSKQTKTGVEIHSNLADGSLTIQSLEQPDLKKIVHFRSKSTFIPLAAGRYQLTFSPVPNYRQPDSLILTQTANERSSIQALYQAEDTFVDIPAGPAIIGDPFSDNKQNERPAQEVYVEAFAIATYEVTNAQYTQWLTQAFQNKKAKWDPKRPGYVIDEEGSLLCRTMTASPLSQIQADGNIFSSFPGKENHPVIEVTWFGAYAYCQDKGYRLPTEREWEKAAGVTISPDGELKRYKYGFGQDTIDRTWANYKDNTLPLEEKQVFTTPVGFYNGTNRLPLTLADRSQQATHDAKSPWGAYDMSGNVWEWVASWDELKTDDTHKIVKGGCYDSLANGVRVSERLALPPDYADSCTGFRVAR